MAFPRPRGRGAIEAGLRSGEPALLRHFRDRAVAAPLKLVGEAHDALQVYISATARSRPH